MAYKIDESKCVNCAVCEPECPVGSISESGNTRIIDENTCISCGTCVGVCPSGAIAEA
ncbi:MAG: 4Fe-4S binding protein [Treponema sp.]|nr:4Fe-4S binding protein [Treponema sp.]